jgi:hypothetical protein
MTILLSLFMTGHESEFFPNGILYMTLPYLVLFLPFIVEWNLIRILPGKIRDIPFFKEHLIMKGCLIIFAIMFTANVYEGGQRLPYFILSIPWFLFGLVRFGSMLYGLWFSKENEEFYVYKVSYMFSGLLSIVSAAYFIADFYLRRGTPRHWLFYLAVWTWLASKVVISYSTLHAMMGLTSSTSEAKARLILKYSLPLAGMGSPMIDAISAILLAYNFNEFLLTILILKIMEAFGLVSQYALALLYGFQEANPKTPSPTPPHSDHDDT